MGDDPRDNTQACYKCKDHPGFKKGRQPAPGAAVPVIPSADMYQPQTQMQPPVSQMGGQQMMQQPMYDQYGQPMMQGQQMFDQYGQPMYDQYGQPMMQQMMQQPTYDVYQNSTQGGDAGGQA
jgi:hypothetical protein